MDARGERNGSTAIAVEIILITELTGGGGRRGRFLSANFSLAPSLSLSRAENHQHGHRHEQKLAGPFSVEWWKFEASRVNLNFFYCVLTCHTCDHAIKVSRFLFSPFHPQTEKDRHVWETATCAFLIIPRYFLLARIIMPAHVTVPHTRYSTLRAPSFLLLSIRTNGHFVWLYIIRIGKFSWKVEFLE